jgi:hypothetical protein
MKGNRRTGMPRKRQMQDMENLKIMQVKVGGRRYGKEKNGDQLWGTPKPTPGRSSKEEGVLIFAT